MECWVRRTQPVSTRGLQRGADADAVSPVVFPVIWGADISGVGTEWDRRFRYSNQGDEKVLAITMDMWGKRRIAGTSVYAVGAQKA